MEREDRDLLWQEKKRPESIVTKGFDGQIKPLSRKSPVFPSACVGQYEEGSALIELLVDIDGHARLPRVVKCSDPAFGYAAVQAVCDWRFEVPRMNGKPVVVRVQVPISFNAKATAPVASSGSRPSDKS